MYLTTITMFFFFYFILQLRHSGKVFFIQKPDRTPFFPGQKQMTAHPMPESQRGDLSQRPHLELWIPDYPHAEKYSVKLAEYFPYVFSSTHPPCSCLLQRHEAERALTGSWRNKTPRTETAEVMLACGILAFLRGKQQRHAVTKRFSPRTNATPLPGGAGSARCKRKGKK